MGRLSGRYSGQDNGTDDTENADEAEAEAEAEANARPAATNEDILLESVRAASTATNDLFAAARDYSREAAAGQMAIVARLGQMEQRMHNMAQRLHNVDDILTAEGPRP